jgi:hypothetical protein
MARCGASGPVLCCVEGSRVCVSACVDAAGGLAVCVRVEGVGDAAGCVEECVRGSCEAEEGGMGAYVCVSF